MFISYFCFRRNPINVHYAPNHSRRLEISNHTCMYTMDPGHSDVIFAHEGSRNKRISKITSSFTQVFNHIFMNIYIYIYRMANIVHNHTRIF